MRAALAFAMLMALSPSFAAAQDAGTPELPEEEAEEEETAPPQAHEEEADTDLPGPEVVTDEASELEPVPPPPPPVPVQAQADDVERPGGFAEAGPSAEERRDIRFRDANVDRVIAVSTAETHPAGTFYVTDYEIAALSVGYALSDRVQLTATGLPPTFEEIPSFLDVALKVNIARGSVGRVALTGSVGLLVDGDEELFVGGRLAAIGQLCLEDDCMSHVTFALGTFLNNGLDRIFPWSFSTGLVVHVSELVALLFEPVFTQIFGEEFRDDERSLFTLGYGLRLTGTNWAFDISLVRPFIEDFGEESPLVMGIPWLSVTFRTDPGGPSL